MKTILLTGASGFLGWNLCRTALGKYHVAGMMFKRGINLPGVDAIFCDITDYSALKAVFSKVRPDFVIHCAAFSNPNFCQRNPEISWLVNVTASVNIAGLCSDAAIPCVFTSSDLVFDGNAPPYNESSRVSPVNLYGEQKAEAEKEMLDCHDKMVVCRMPLMYGDAPSDAASFIQQLISDLKNGKAATLFTDEFRTPVSAPDASKGLLLALEKMSGIVHLGGKERVSRYEFGLKLVNQLGKPRSFLKKNLREEIPMPAPRPRDVSLDSSKAFDIGYDPGLIQNELAKLDCINDRRQVPEGLSGPF